MELTSYYDNVFYTSSTSDHGYNLYPVPDIHQMMHYPDHTSVSESQYSPAFYSQYSPSTSPATPSPQSPASSPFTPVTSSTFFSENVSKPQRQKNSKLPRIPPIEVLQQRRLAANARERKRANKINFAFNRLRKVLPGFTDREISKFEAIQLARDYISQLSTLLEQDNGTTAAAYVKHE